MRMQTAGVAIALVAGALLVQAGAQSAPPVGRKLNPQNLISGSAAFADYRGIKPGTLRKITPADLPRPFATDSANNSGMLVPRPADAWPQAMAGFKVDLYASDLHGPRQLRFAPNGDAFVVESGAGQIKVFRGRNPQGRPEQVSVFATGLKQPYGVAFYPPGADPQWVYVGNTNAVVRFAYKNGDLKASGAAQAIVRDLPEGGGHWTRDVVFSPDGQKMFVGVGSASNVDDPDQ